MNTVLEKNNRTAEIRASIKDFAKTCEKYYNGELSIPEYKSISGKFGTYSERGHKTGMLRLRVPGGMLDTDKLGFVIKSIEKYNIEKIHFTTNQSIQLHHLKPEIIPKLMLEAFDAGILTIGGGGDNPRNVLCSPLSGVEKGEFFDVSPYAKKASEFLTGLIGKINLPRKLKVSFSNTAANIVHATYRDMGFVAKANGKFDLYTAGGLGVNPEFGIKTAEDIEPKDILYYIMTMVQIFMKYGNYENRAKARTRYIPRTIGEEKYLSEFNRILKEIKDSEDLTLNIIIPSVTKQSNGSLAKPSKNIIEQKQNGLYAVKYHPALGNPNLKTLKNLYDKVSCMDDVRLRLSTKEEMFIINLTGDEANEILDLLKSDNSNTELQESISCVGATICQQGIANSSGLLEKIIEVDKKENFADGVLPKLCISGCQSSCAAHETANVGFKGGKKKVDGVLSDVFDIFFDGCETQGNEHFGEVLGTIPADKIPEMFRKLGKEIQSKNSTFESWITDNKDKFMDIVKEYAI